MKKKIVFLSHLDLNLYKFRLHLMREMVKQGYEVFALCPSGPNSVKFEKYGITHVSYEICRESLNPFRELKTIFSIGKIIKEISPQILHTNTMKPNIYGAFAGAYAGVPVKIASVTGLGSFFISTESDGVINSIFRKFLIALYRTAMSLVDVVIFLNVSDKKEFITLGVVDERKAVLVPGDGVDVNYFVNPSISTDNGTVTYLMISRLIRDKGVNEYLEAAAVIKKRYQEKVQFVLAGFEDHGNPWPADMNKLLELAAAGVVKYVGYSEDVRTLLRDADVYVLPSYREGLSVSILEAMSMGLPIITTDAPGCRDLVENNVNGLVVVPKDSLALCKAIETLYLSPMQRKMFGCESRKIVESEYSSDYVGKKIIEVYSATTKRKSRTTLC